MQNVVDGVGRRTILGRFSFFLSALVLIWLVEACSICAGAPPGRGRNSVVRPELVWDAGSDALLDYWWVSGDRMILKFRRVRSRFDGSVVMRQVNVHTHALSERAAGLAGRDLTGAIPSPSGSVYLLHDRADGMHAYWDVLSDDGAIVCRKADLTLSPPRGVYWLPGGREWYEYNFGGPEENIIIRYVVDNSRRDNTDETAPAKYVLPHGRVALGVAGEATLATLALEAGGRQYLEMYTVGERLARIKRVRIGGYVDALWSSAIDPGTSRLCWWSFDNDPKFKPNTGRYIGRLFVSSATGHVGSAVISIPVTDTEAMSPTEVRSTDKGGIPLSTRWSPDGTRITYMLDGKVWSVAVKQ